MKRITGMGSNLANTAKWRPRPNVDTPWDEPVERQRSRHFPRSNRFGARATGSSRRRLVVPSLRIQRSTGSVVRDPSARKCSRMTPRKRDPDLPVSLACPGSSHSARGRARTTDRTHPIHGDAPSRRQQTGRARTRPDQSSAWPFSCLQSQPVLAGWRTVIGRANCAWKSLRSSSWFRCAWSHAQ